jgi:hypothetical protein
MGNWAKQPSSRPTITTALTSASSPIKAGPETYQLRVTATTVAALSITDSSATQLSSTASPQIAANVAADFFTITPGQWYFAYGSASITEMV